MTLYSLLENNPRQPKTLNEIQTVERTRLITTDGDKSYPVAIHELKKEHRIPYGTYKSIRFNI